MSKAIITAEASGVTKEDTNILTNVMAGATSIFKSFSEEGNTYYSEKAMGQAVLAALVGGVVVGDRFGDKIPFVGGRR